MRRTISLLISTANALDICSAILRQPKRGFRRCGLFGDLHPEGVCMPIVDGRNISPDEAMRRRLCPECGAPLSTAQTARGHAQDHWGAGRGFLSAEGQRRRDMLLHFADVFADRTDDEIATLAPTNNFSVITFSELVGFMFALPAGDALYRGDPVSSRMIVFAVIGLSFVLLGPNWPWLKSRLPRRFAASITRVGSDFRWWLAVLILGFIYRNRWTVAHRAY